MKTLATAAAISLCFTGTHADTAGLRSTEVFMPHHEASTRIAIWYPSTARAASETYADSLVFQGVAAHPDGPVAPGQYPMVLFSHGMGGTDRAQAWLGAALAERGAIVVMVNHPNSTWGDFDMSKGIEHWTRAQDVSVAFDAVLGMPGIQDSVDTTRVMAAGFSYGGWTALSLGGAKGNHAGFVDACLTLPDMEACGLFLSDEVNVQGVDPAAWNARYADPRVTHVVAIDPGFVWGLEAADISGLVPSTHLIGLGTDGERMLATDFDRSGLAALLGDRKSERIAPAFHFSVMPICKPAGEAILAEDNDDPVCTDPAGANRAAIHAAIIDLIADELGL